MLLKLRTKCISEKRKDPKAICASALFPRRVKEPIAIIRNDRAKDNQRQLLGDVLTPSSVLMAPSSLDLNKFGKYFVNH